MKCTCRKDGQVDGKIHDPNCAVSQFGGLEPFFPQCGKAPKYEMYCPFKHGECIKEDCAAFEFKSHSIYMQMGYWNPDRKGEYCGQSPQKYAHCHALKRDLQNIPPLEPPPSPKPKPKPKPRTYADDAPGSEV